jgi:hypothetical protein
MNSISSKFPAVAVPVEPATGAEQAAAEPAAASIPPAASPREFGGRKDGTEPTRFGDWEKNGRCIDF